MNSENDPQEVNLENPDSLFIEVNNKCDDSGFTKVKDILGNSVSLCQYLFLL